MDEPAPQPPEAQAVALDPAPALEAESPQVKFERCRWRAAPEGAPSFCSHRDVLPLAGSREFDPQAWCKECSLFKPKRAPRKPQDPLSAW